MKTDAQIADAHAMLPIRDIVKTLNISEDCVEFYGHYKAKLPINLIDEKKVQQSKLILVTALSPTPAGEGKTTVSIGLAQSLNKIGHQTTVVLREPSLGPIFGIKGGATGGGYSQVVPMEDINLHFTGDFSAVEKAHNLLAALIDNEIQSKKQTLKLDPRTISWKRVLDMNDRSLRSIIIGLGGMQGGVPRETGFDITAASEVMAILCMATSMADLKYRLGNIFIGYNVNGDAIYARDLKAEGAMAALLKDAIKPNLVQTLEGTPALIHGGPFANIAQGTNSILATKLAMSHSEMVVTEAGFGADLGAEKFLDIKCPAAGIAPKVVVIVATLRALRYHGGVEVKEANSPNLNAVKKGFANLEKHIENMQLFNLPTVVAINYFDSDTLEETQWLQEACEKINIKAIPVRIWEKGGEGGLELAKEVAKIADENHENYHQLYDVNTTPEEKIHTIATKIYGADHVEYTVKAKKQLHHIYRLGADKLPVCIAKTQKSLSDVPKKIGRPKDFSVIVREFELASGAGFIIPIMGDIMRMPGLPPVPAAEHIDIDENGVITGLF